MKDFIERHKLLTRFMAIVMTGICVKLAFQAEPNEMLIQYAFWTVGLMFSVFIFGDKMLDKIVEMIKAWKGS